MSTQQQQNKCITLKGSASMVRQYLHHGINNVLYQRGVCPSRDFEQTRYYGLDLFTMKNSRQTKYFTDTLNDIENFLIGKEVDSVSLLLKDKNTEEVLEEWKFEIDYDTRESNTKSSKVGKDPQTVRNEICAVMRQIIGATTILPLLDKGKVDYEIEATPRPGASDWPEWSWSTESEIRNKEKLSFRSFSTSVHSVSTSVSYKGF